MIRGRPAKFVTGTSKVETRWDKKAIKSLVAELDKLEAKYSPAKSAVQVEDVTKAHADVQNNKFLFQLSKDPTKSESELSGGCLNPYPQSSGDVQTTRDQPDGGFAVICPNRDVSLSPPLLSSGNIYP